MTWTKTLPACLSPTSSTGRVCLCGLLALTLALLAYHPDLSTSGDDAEYVRYARALTGGDRWYDTAESRFPPLFPVLVALTDSWGVEADKVWALSAYVALVGLAALWGGWLAGLGVCLSPIPLWLSGQVMADLPFAFLVLLGVGWTARDRWWAGLLVLCAACWLKSAGAAVILGVLAVEVWNGKWQRALKGAVVAAFAVVPSMGLGYFGQTDLTGPLEVLERASHNALYYLTEAPELALLLPLVVLTGLTRSMARWWGPLLASLALLLVWPWQAHRFLAPVVPLVWMMMRPTWSWVQWIASKQRARPFAVVLLVILVNLRVIQATELLSASLTGPWADYRQAGDWLAEHTPADAVVWGTKPHQLVVWSGRNVARYPYADPLTVQVAAQEQGVTHVVLDALGPPSSRFLLPALDPRQWHVAWRSGQVQVLERSGR